MSEADETARAIREKVERMSDLLFRRDLALADELWSPGFRLVGSEAGEVADDREALLDQFQRLYARPVRYRWEFARFDVQSLGDVAWAFAEGHLTATSDTGVGRFPYRITAVFAHDGIDWRWRLYSGSEPAGAPA
jgi:hypothetical protein